MLARHSLETLILGAVLLLAIPCVRVAEAGEHPGKDAIAKNGYKGPATCEGCHPGKAKEFLGTVHWTHAGKAKNVENTDPRQVYGMKNRTYTMCNGNDTVNNLKKVPQGAGVEKVKFTGCNSCHPGNHLQDVGSTGPEAEASIDCLVCHSTRYDYGKRKAYLDEKGNTVMGQDRSTEAALAIGKPTVKNCMVCHESAGGGVLIKRGFHFAPETDVHAAKGMVCVDCHKAKDHRIPTGTDPNIWATDGLKLSCAGGECHKAEPHKDAELNRHTARIACQTCHIPRTGGAFAKDFTKWSQGSDKYWEPTTLGRDANESSPAYAWFNGSVANRPRFIGPKGSRNDKGSKIQPFKVFEGRGFFDRKTGKLLAMDFAPPMSDGDTLKGIASAAKTLGIKSYDPVPGWQTIYFGSNHLVVPKDKALSCQNCHARNGVLDFRELGYGAKETEKLTSAATYFDKAAERLKEQW